MAFTAPRVWITLFMCVLMASCGTMKRPAVAVSSACNYDKASLMALDEHEFDQDLAQGGGGWRALAAQPGCESRAADLIRDYRQVNGIKTPILFWHEAQLRAFVGDSRQAILLMARSRKPIETDLAGWNPYVDASIAFLQKDEAGLRQARSNLAAAQSPRVHGFPPVQDGFVEMQMGNGQTLKLAWPPNLDVVDGLLHCFDQSYSRAYSMDCRVPPS